MGFGVNARFDTDMYIYQGNFVWGTGELSGDNFDPSTDFTAFGFMAEAGRYLKNDVDGQATAEFGLAWTKSKEEAGDAVNFDETSLRDLRRMLPYNQIFYTRWLTDEMERQVADALGLPTRKGLR